MPQVTHAAPPLPQVGNVGVVHVPPEQQPLAHDWASQTHEPSTHTCPGEHAGPEPHSQVPPFEQRLAFVVSHPVQASPPTPHAASEGDSHVAPTQQPAAQFDALHPVQTPPTQFWLLGHVSHADPLAPQDAVVVPATHWPSEQQPSGHEVTLHTHAPCEQICPVAHAGPPPHVHTPAVEQPSADAPHALHVAPSVPHVAVVGASQMAPAQHPVLHDVASQTHLSLTQCWPVAHAGPVPHVQAPAVQALAFVGSQVVQAAPFVPHVAVDAAGEMQVVPSQQPVGHEAASHTHDPAEHS